MWQNFVLLFTEMNVAAAVCLIVGLIFCLVEIIYPGFGFFGIIGSTLLLVGVIIRVIFYKSADPVALFFILLLLISIFVILGLVIMSFSLKRGWISRSALVETSTAVSVGISEGTEDYSYLIGEVGLTNTMLRPSGTVKINDKGYDVVSDGEFIEKGKQVMVIKVEGVKIVVQLITTEA